MSRQIAVVTGAAGGFGTAISKVLLDIGYLVAATDVSSQKLALLKERLGHPESLATFEMDVTDLASVERAAQQIVETFGDTITVLVNNAGIINRAFCLSGQGFSETTKVINVNLIGAFNSTSIFVRYMARLKYGRIINIASVAGIWGAAGSSAYGASKAGLISATESWGRELGPLNISVTAVAPGVCKTDMLEQFVESGPMESAGEDKVVRSIVPVGRWGTPDDVAEVVGFLASCKTNYLNSAVIPLDGGMRVGTL
ncbi:SDR family NAD(P)-dependent oxidoreductase [Xenorhabdus bovienii]|uniref:3-oxoacyl-(Acyl-carrier-protein) reductase (3-ketoacyl-acyl carrier protein reductase) n=1 Tax=Xenorhabdus bovienii str. puntauvense TaxID=1398201 RepID=A0A077NIW8_XENBV|nr:SDR family NAD(P)-dependent oxidoreductase [Xenorhabdus bovienii]CDG88354.1 3-oxoacyl-(acyl-carrier-protein) reductase (3-ketoacyl-acyl carrier protein reductase) [Xenorhabdus bovienii str. feltiae France]CDG90956.1 3-oxoacyl-(acyl-carrier-protein) reductase (3-ketoacyl-acyl carrier protein reductase) [Xenorhabdus bovienii str. feltiae Florida]CDG98373.1 3-oxoacyl-(acyl-carrier-protein) reductase (3-ketoacyl-acyl carrier protein reductase) [Xenorhabdus bovienii str. puntauvense]